jgi:hypothetical protein
MSSSHPKMKKGKVFGDNDDEQDEEESTLEQAIVEVVQTSKTGRGWSPFFPLSLQSPGTKKGRTATAGQNFTKHPGPSHHVGCDQ